LIEITHANTFQISSSYPLASDDFMDHLDRGNLIKATGFGTDDMLKRK